MKAEEKILVVPEGKVIDYIDGTIRNDTPEEYVRQNIEKRLINEHKYKKNQVQVEFTLRIGTRKPRADLVIFDENAPAQTQEYIKTIIECKKESIEPSSKTDGVGQLKSYMSASVNCEWGMWTNGKIKEVYRKVLNEDGNYEFVEYNDIPSANGNTEQVDKPKRNSLIRAVEDNLLFTFRTCHNHIYVTDGMQKQPAFFELLKVIFCKIEDEKNRPHELEFYTTSAERSNPDGQLTVYNRISKIFVRVKEKYGKIFDANDEIKLKPRSLAYIVSELQKYSLLNTDIDIKGKAYEELVGANLRGDRGEFFTPRNVMRMTVAMLDPQRNEKVMDPTCGTGGFIVNAMIHVIESLEKSLEEEFEKPKHLWDNYEYSIYSQLVSDICSVNYYGFDINPDLVKATRMNMVMNNDGSENILQNNTLLHPHEWSVEFKTRLASSLNINPANIRSHKDIEFFDVIVSNPPFGSKIQIKDITILEQYDLGYIWEKTADGWSKTDRLQSSVPPEQLFIERCIQFLKPGGRLGIVLPDAILGSPSLGYIRFWLMKYTKIIASIDLHVDTFQPRNGTQTSVLILQKKTSEEVAIEETNGFRENYSVFMAMVKKIGHDKRGTPLFKRDIHGNEILVTKEEIDYADDGTQIVTLNTVKVRDDETLDVPELFKNWRIQEGIYW